MSNFIKKFKRSMAIVLSITTFAWAVGPVALLVPSTALAGTAKAGDLIKMDGLSSVYYLGADSKRYVFPNETTYMSWYGDFSGVKTVSQSELESYPLAKNATMRPGTKLVKITTDPKVYAVEAGGVLKWIPNETTASTLYGANWAKKVVDVPDSFFVNYTVSTEQISATAYPNGTLIKYAGSEDVYVVTAATTARKVSTAGMTANRYKAADVVTAPSTITYTSGTEVAAVETALADLSSTGVVPTTTTTTTTTGTGLTVALASDTPAAASIIADNTPNKYPQALIPFAKFNFTAGADGDVTVTQLKLTRTGIASDSDIGNLYLYDNGTKLAEYNSFSDKVVTFVNANGLFTVTKGTTKTISLKGDLARGAISVTSGKTIGFQIAAAKDVTAGSASVSGTFPASGSLMSTAAVADLGHIYFQGASGANGTYPSTVKADEKDKQLWSVNVTADAQNMQIKYLKFTMVGTIAVTEIKNIRLEVAGVQVGTAQELAADKTLVFDLASNPITINSGVTKSIALRGDMKGGSGRVFKFSIQKSSDVLVYDTNYNIYVTPNVNSPTTAFGVIQPATGNGTSVDAGTMTLGVATDSPTGNIPDGATAITFGKFSFYAAGEDVKVENLVVKCTGSDTSDYLDNLKLLLDGSQVGTTDTTIKCDGGTDTTTFTFGNTFIVAAGTTKYLTAVADTTDSTVEAGATFAIALNEGASNAVGQATMTSINTTAQTGRTLTTQSGQVTVVKNPSFANRTVNVPTGTVSAVEAQIASFILTAGSGEAVDVTQIKLTDGETDKALGEDFQNLKIKHAGTQLGTTIASLNTTAGDYTFTPSTAIRIVAGAQYIVDIYADIKSSNTNTSIAPVCKVASAGITATGVTTGASANSATGAVELQNAYVSGRGSLTITADSDTPVAQQMVMGETDKEVVRFKLAADVAENIIISEIYVAALVPSGATGTFQNMKLYVDGTQVGSAANFGNTASTTHAIAPFTGLSLTIPKNSNKVLVVKADVSTSANATSGNTAKFKLLPYYSGVTSESIVAKGASSGLAITDTYLDFSADTDAAVEGNTMTVYKTKVSVTWASDTPSGASTGMADAAIGKIQISNSSNEGTYAATIKALNLAISQTGISNTADRNLKIYKDSLTSGNLLLTTAYKGSGTENFGNTRIVNGTGASNFPSTEIASGSTKTFYVILDTTDAGLNDRLSIYVAADGLSWYDGTSTVNAVDNLPLTPKTLTY